MGTNYLRLNLMRLFGGKYVNWFFAVYMLNIAFWATIFIAMNDTLYNVYSQKETIVPEDTLHITQLAIMSVVLSYSQYFCIAWTMLFATQYYKYRLYINIEMNMSHPILFILTEIGALAIGDLVIIGMPVVLCPFFQLISRDTASLLLDDLEYTFVILGAFFALNLYVMVFTLFICKLCRSLVKSIGVLFGVGVLRFVAAVVASIYEGTLLEKTIAVVLMPEQVLLSYSEFSSHMIGMAGTSLTLQVVILIAIMLVIFKRRYEEKPITM